MPMYLTQTAEYALRAMTWLANRDDEEEGGVRAADLAEQVSVPLPYLQKILRRLVVAGLLESRKGHGGGFRLAYEPEDIRFDEILKATDFDVEENRCAFGWAACDPDHPCPVHPAWARLNEGVGRWASETTLADVLVDELPSVRAQGRLRRKRAGKGTPGGG